MKINITPIALLIVFTFMLFSNRAYSQNELAENFEKISSKISTKGDFKVFENPKVDKSDRTLLVPAGDLFVKKLKISASTFQFVDTFHRGCFIYRAMTSSCDDCTLLWFDRNGDGLLQIRRELRAVCKSTLEACDIEIEKIVGGGSCD